MQKASADHPMVDLSIVVPAYLPEKHLKNFFARLKIIDEKLHELKISSELIFIHSGTKFPIAEQVPKLKTVKFVYQKFEERLTPSEARNIGIKMSEGEYLLFHDVDDLLNVDFPCSIPQFCKKDRIEAIKYDLIIFRYRKIRNGVPELIGHGLGRSDFQLGPKDIEEYLNLYIAKPHVFTLFVHCWSKLYLRSFLLKNNVAFNPSLEQLEDVNFNFRALNSWPKVYYSSDVCYDYNISIDTSNLSAMSGAKGLDDIKNTIKALLPVKKYLMGLGASKNSIRGKIGHLYATTFVLWIIRVSKKVKDSSALPIFLESYMKSTAVRASMLHYRYFFGTSWIIPLLIICQKNHLMMCILEKKFGGNNR